LSSCLPKEYPIDELVGLVETSIGKMVPIMTKADLEGDPLLVFAEPYNSLIVDKKGFRGPIPEVKGLCPRENIKAWVDRKAFVHNFGHATVAYFGAYKYPGATYIYEVLKDKEVYRFAFDAMLQSASVLQANYPNDFSLADLQGHIEDLLYRFQNKALKDTIFRVGQDRLRKLGPDDRFMGIIRLAISLELKFDKILKAMAYAFYFQAKDENSNISEPDILFDNYLEQGPEYTLQRVCGFDQSKDKNLFEEFMTYHEALNVRNSLKMRKLQIKNSRYDDKTKTIGL
ncbi:MAG: hypothetical protein MI975_14700, partial [Cytophagales bacterium]|nr:hypothetical protein [Cytophagales bacterium]